MLMAGPGRKRNVGYGARGVETCRLYRLSRSAGFDPRQSVRLDRDALESGWRPDRIIQEVDIRRGGVGRVSARCCYTDGSAAYLESADCLYRSGFTGVVNDRDGGTRPQRLSLSVSTVSAALIRVSL
jgi:hypothetical protein